MRSVAGKRRRAHPGVALAAVGVLGAGAAGAVPAPTSAPAVAGHAVRLAADGESVLNIPFNLFQQIVNIPATEVAAVNTFASSLFFTGPWVVASATNIWGEDAADPGHFMGLVDMLIPFKEISGLGSPEIDPVALAAGTAGLGQQLAMLSAALLPPSGSCSAEWCAPMYPTSEITGLTPLDRAIWTLAVALGQQAYPLQDNWFTVSFAELTSGQFTFGDVVSPSSGVGPGGSVPSDEVFGFPGTIPGPDGQNLMPWSGVTFKFDPFGPLAGFYHSLLAPPDPDGFEFPSIEEIGRALQSLVASLAVAFTPFAPGGDTCWGACDVPQWLTVEGLVSAVGNLWPGNPLIDHWLDLTANGMANAATQFQIDWAIEFRQGMQTIFDLGNPLPPEIPSYVSDPVPFDVSPLMAGVIAFAQDSGIRGFVQVLADLAGFEPSF